MRKQQQRRQQQRAERIDMPERIEADASELQAVSSPKRQATKPCAASWKVMAMTSGSTQTERS